MKKLLLILMLPLVILWSCSEEGPPEEPPANKNLIVGTWQSQSASHRIVVNGQSSGLDSAYDGLVMKFTSGGNYLYRKVVDVLDTSRYNVQGDTVFLIRNARAYDTLFIDFLDHSNLKLVTESKESSIAGKLLLEETVIDFYKLPGDTIP